VEGAGTWFAVEEAGRVVAKLRDIPREPPEQLGIGALEDWERIEEALGHEGTDLKRRERLCRDLRSIYSLYFGDLALPKVRASNVDSALTVLRVHAAALQAYLWRGRTSEVKSPEDLLKPPETPPPDPPDDGLDEFERWAMFYIGSEILPAEKHYALLDGLEELIAAVDAAKKALPEDKGGRPRNHQLQGMIYGLAKYYAQETLKKRKKAGLSRDRTGNPSGPFFRFVCTALRVFVPDQVGSDDALYSEIRRTLKIKRWRLAPAWPLCSLLRTKTPIRFE
jgi:hypothetical protein